MEMTNLKLTQKDDSFQLQIFEPNPHLIEEDIDEMRERSSAPPNVPLERKLSLFTLRLEPEKKLTLFALRLAVLEKAASGLGGLGFIWATVVLLGGFAASLEKIDFWFITTILVIEGTRIFSRSHELEWQHQATWSLSDAGLSSFQLLKSSSDFLFQTVKGVCDSIPRIPPQESHHDREQEASNQTNVPMYRIFLSKNTSRILYWLQISSASACVTLSLMRLTKQNYGEMEGEDSKEKAMRDSSLNIFYVLAFFEAMLFLLEKAYWEWQVTYCKLMEEVNKECELGPSGMVSIRKFFYDTYSSCINGSIFDGLKMDLASFGMDLLTANSFDEQLIGTRILQKFALNERFSDDTLRKIGISMDVMERLVEMLNWKDPEEEEIRRSAAEILSKLTGKKQSSIRVAAIPGAMESISSLLHIKRSLKSGATDEIFEREVIHDQENYEFSAFTLLGLLILKKLAREHENCEKIGHTRGLISKIIDLSHTTERLLRDKTAAESQILMVKRSLQVVKMLVSTTGEEGKWLHREVSEIVFTVSNIGEILRYGEKYGMLQKLGIEIITCLALEEDVAERIGSNRGILKELFCVFFDCGREEGRNDERVGVAGEALVMLMLASKRNACRILKLKVVGKLVEGLEDPVIQVNSARILSNLCNFADELDFCNQLKGITGCASSVLKAIMSGDNKLQEVMIGLAAKLFSFMDSEESKLMLKQAGIKDEKELAMKLVQILKYNQYPQIRVPRLRRYVIELAICMVKNMKNGIQTFKDLGMVQELENVVETTTEVESFIIFSGSVGVIRHRTSMESLVDTVLELLC